MTREEFVGAYNVGYRDGKIEEYCPNDYADVFDIEQEPKTETKIIGRDTDGNWHDFSFISEQEQKTDTWSIKEVAKALEKHGFGRLEQEPKTDGDCINKEKVIDILDYWYDSDSDGYIQAAKSINELPSVTPQEPKTGHWIDVDGVWFKCSECDAHRKMCSGWKEYFCPNCGAKMESEGKE